jgi:hypothetical protein
MFHYRIHVAGLLPLCHLVDTIGNRGTFVGDFKFIGTDEYKSSTFIGARNR